MYPINAASPQRIAIGAVRALCSYCASSVEFPFGGKIGNARLFWRVKTAKVFQLPADTNTGLPLSFVSTNPKKPGCATPAWFALVLGIYQERGISQVFNSTIKSIAVLVVNDARRPFTISPKPDESMGKIGSAFNGYATVSGLGIDRAGNVARNILANSNQPKPLIVMSGIKEDGSQFFRGESSFRLYVLKWFAHIWSMFKCLHNCSSDCNPYGVKYVPA